MFTVVRIVIGCATFGGLFLWIKASGNANERKKYILAATIALALTTISAFLPFENLFMTFDTPESVYHYVNSPALDVKLVVEGQNCDLVIGDNGGTDVYLIVPKTTDGWKLGLGADTKRIMQKIVDGVVVYIYQYKDTEDYFVAVLDGNDREPIIEDARNSTFFTLEHENNASNTMLDTYIASVPNLDQQYWVRVNGREIPVFDA